MIPAQALLRSELLDSQTCDLCMDELNGIMLPADDPQWLGPLGQAAHDNCRFMLVPVFGGIDPVMDYTPVEDVPVLIEHLRRLLPVAEAQALVEELVLTNGAALIAGRRLTWADLYDIIEDEELLYRIFGLGG